MATLTTQLIQMVHPPELTPEAIPEAPPEVSPAMFQVPLPADKARLDDLAEVIRAYNQVTDNLQRSHEALRQQVVRLQEQLASADAQLQRSKRLTALGEMAAGIAHEVRNPLAAIQLYATMIAEDLAAEDRLTNACDMVRKIASAARGLDAIVRDVLNFARELTPHWTQVRADELFVWVLEAHRPALEAAGVTVARQPEQETFPFRGDAQLLQQALLNLVRNAVDAMTEPRTATRRVLTLAAEQRGERVVLIVRDTGPGIAEADIDRIFNPFFTTRRAGTGLGLAIVHRIVDAHGGAISVRNDHGAVFALDLPKVQGQRPKAQVPSLKSEIPSRQAEVPKGRIPHS